MLSGSLLEIVSDILDILEQLHTVSIEFTVTRENDCIVGLESTFQCLLAEQKLDFPVKITEKNVDLVRKAIKKYDKTVASNC